MLDSANSEPVKILTSGLVVESYEETGDDNTCIISFSFFGIDDFETEFPDLDTILKKTDDLFRPGSGNEVILQILTNKGWVADGDLILRRFRIAVGRDTVNKKIIFTYTLVESTDQLGMAVEQ